MSQQSSKTIEFLIDGLEVALNSLRASLKKIDVDQLPILRLGGIISELEDARRSIQSAQELYGQT